MQVSSGVYLWLLILMVAISIPVKHLRKIVNLGGKRDGFFWGSLNTYIILAGAVSLANTIYFYTIEKLLNSTGYFVGVNAFIQNTALMDNHYINVNLIELFGWDRGGIATAFFQQFAFLLLFAVVVHTLTSIQGKWYGWVTNLTIAAILATFIPIRQLRPALLWFFDLIIYSSAFLQISACLLLAAVIYSLNKPILARKVI
jgi:hypothetical protein